MPMGRIGQDFIVNTTAQFDQSEVAVTALTDGRYIVTWRSDDPNDGSGSCVRARLFNTDGSAAGSDFIVNTTTSVNQTIPTVAALADGRFILAWGSDDTADGSGGCLRARLFDDDGNGIGNDFIVNTTTVGPQFDPSATVLADGRFLIAWQSSDVTDGEGSCVRARLYNPDASSVSAGDFIVNTSTAGFQSMPSITALTNGGFVVTYFSGDLDDGSGACVRARIYKANGTPIADDFIVNTTTQNQQRSPSVTPLANGGFVVAWESDDTGDGSAGCVRGRIFKADGTGLNDFVVDTTATSAQRNPSVAALADGRFIVTWASDDAGDGAPGCVRARVFNLDGSPNGTDFIVNTTTVGFQIAPSVAALEDGRVVIAWRSEDTGDGSLSCIRSQIFDPTVFVGTGADETWSGGNFADRMHGYGGNDTLFGFGGNDQINGDAANDTLNGGAGNDRLMGGRDADTLIGGLGRDILSGGAGNDDFVFRLKDSGKGAKADVIIDFNNGDQIDLSTFDINAKKGGIQHFKSFAGAAKFHHKVGEVHYVKKHGYVVVEGDTNGDGKADFQIEVHNSANHLTGLGAGDFILH